MAGRGVDRPPGLFAFLFGELGRAITDIRQRVVEEGWFGRVTTPPQRDPLNRTLADQDASDRASAFDAQWAPRQSNREQDQARDQDIGQDR